jgi:hypothetical protein
LWTIFAALLMTSVVAFAGATNIPTTGIVTLPNLTGMAANDLHVSLDSGVTSLGAWGGIFPDVTHDADLTDWTLSGSVIAPGESATIQWDSTGSWRVPQLMSYYWSSNGTQIGETMYPLYFTLNGVLVLRLWLRNPNASSVSYSALDIVVDDVSRLSDGSGTLAANGARLLGIATPPEGYMLHVLDQSTGADLTYFAGDAERPDAPSPEPASLVLTGFGLLAAGIVARRRLRRR